MTNNPITIQSSATLPEAISIMASKGIGNLIVTENNNTVIGIVTEREILQYLSLNRETPNKSITYIKLQSFSKIAPADTVYAAAKSMISNKTRLLVFEDNNNNKLATHSILCNPSYESRYYHRQRSCILCCCAWHCKPTFIILLSHDVLYYVDNFRRK